MIEIPIKIDGSDVLFKFNPSTPEEAAQMLAKAKARMNFMEALRKEKEEMEKESPSARDVDRYLACSEKLESVTRQLSKAMLPILDKVVEPDRETFVSYMARKDLDKEMDEVFGKYFESLAPSEEERKKSEGRSTHATGQSSGRPAESVKSGS